MKKRQAEEEVELQASEQMGTGKRRSVQDSPTSEGSNQSIFSISALLGRAGEGGTRPSLVHAAFAEQGGRAYMEDTHSHAAIGHHAVSYGVFDGHGGSYVAEYCAQHLLARLQAELAPQSASGAPPDGAAFTSGLRCTFAAVDEELAQSKGREAYICGTTAAVCIITQDNIFTANCGDSRAVLVRTNKILPLTIDHSPTRNDERERIKRAGGSIIWQNGFRVMGALSMTRAIGDHFLRPAGVIPDPEISTVRRSSRDEFLLLATDGLWNYVSCEEAVAVARRALDRADAAALPRRAAALVVPRALTKLALARGGTDNVTVLMVDLRREEGLVPSQEVAVGAEEAPAGAEEEGCSAVSGGGAESSNAAADKPMQLQQEREEAAGELQPSEEEAAGKVQLSGAKAQPLSGAGSAGAAEAGEAMDEDPAPSCSEAPAATESGRPPCHQTAAPAAATAPAEVAVSAAAASGAAAAAARVESPFSTANLQLPVLNLRPLKTRPDHHHNHHHHQSISGAAGAMSRCSSEMPAPAGLPLGNFMASLNMSRARSAPVRLHHFTVTTGGPGTAAWHAAAPTAAAAVPCSHHCSKEGPGAGRSSSFSVASMCSTSSAVVTNRSSSFTAGARRCTAALCHQVLSQAGPASHESAVITQCCTAAIAVGGSRGYEAEDGGFGSCT